LLSLEIQISIVKKHTKEEEQFLITLGKRVQKLRKISGYTQLQLAALYDSEKASLCRIETGKINPTITTLSKIAKILQIPMPRLFSE